MQNSRATGPTDSSGASQTGDKSPLRSEPLNERNGLVTSTITRRRNQTSECYPVIRHSPRIGQEAKLRGDLKNHAMTACAEGTEGRRTVEVACFVEGQADNRGVSRIGGKGV